MNRYHKSFIGLMEQNKDGEWVKYSEHVKAQEKLWEYSCTVFHTMERTQERSSSSQKLTEKRYELLKREVTIAKGLIIYGLIIHIIALVFGY
jgi:hypothetical protein